MSLKFTILPMLALSPLNWHSSSLKPKNKSVTIDISIFNSLNLLKKIILLNLTPLIHFESINSQMVIKNSLVYHGFKNIPRLDNEEKKSQFFVETLDWTTKTIDQSK